MSSLNARQQAAVRFVDGPLLVLAGAGSGKTRVITRKVAYLVQECGYRARELAAVTFTNKAAREMKSRVRELLTGSEARGLTVSTFHHLGLGILRREAAAVGLKSGFSLFDERDTAALLADLAGRGRVDGLEEAGAAQISRWKSSLVGPKEAESAAEDDRERSLARLYAEYERSLRAYNVVDFDDLILLPVRLFQERAEVRERWRARVRYLLVDEYQDTNASQYELVRALVGERGALTVVGDDDQSIYAWRGARPENLARLRADFSDLHVIKLEQNYRSTGRILKAANQLISHNPHIFEKRLWSELGPGEPLRVLCAKDEFHEAGWVVSELLSHRFQRAARYRDYAILYRGNHQSRPFEKVLREHGVPYYLSGGTSFFARTEVRDLMAYLRLLTNPDDDTAFLRVVNTPRREIGASTLERLGAYAGERGQSLFAASFELGLEQRLSARAVVNLRRFTDWLGRASHEAAEGDPVQAARDLVRDVAYRDWIEQSSGDPKVAERRLQNVDELLEWLQTLARKADGEPDLAGLSARLTLLDVLERRDEENDQDRVSLMTLHAAKGLEFPHVFLVGVEEELLPHHSNSSEQNLEEERRLAYVGLTRAQRTLTLSFARTRRRFGEESAREPSRFLTELPQEELEWDGREGDEDPDRRRDRGRGHLATMRALLGDG